MQVSHLSAHFAHKPTCQLACRASAAAAQVPAVARQEFLCRTWLSSRTWSSWWSASRTWTPTCKRWLWKLCLKRSGQAGGCCSHLIKADCKERIPTAALSNRWSWRCCSLTSSTVMAVHCGVLVLVSMFCRLGKPLLGFCCMKPLRSRLLGSPVCKLWLLHEGAPLLPG